MPNRIFIDTLFVIALINRRDQYHQQALDLAEQLEGDPLLVTDAVLLEIGKALRLFAQGFALYKSHQDKAWGLVNCISFIVMREAGVN